MEWKYCPRCNSKLNTATPICPVCSYSFGRGNKSETDRVIIINGLSFECPDNYKIGNHPSSDWAHKSIVALSKEDIPCEIYISEYEKYAFDSRAIQNMPLLKKYLEMQGYINVSENRRFPYCFDAIGFSAIGEIKTTILFKFIYGSSNVIMVVANIPLNSNYDYMEDMKIIKNSVRALSNTEKAYLDSEINDEEWLEDWVNSYGSKDCPHCGHTIKEGATRCPFCKKKV